MKIISGSQRGSRGGNVRRWRITPAKRGRNAYSARHVQPVGRRTSSKVYLWRRLIFIIALVVTLSFLGKTVLRFFSVEHISLEIFGNLHYTEVQVYDVLGAKLDNILTNSEEQTAAYLQESLSYIKDARVSRHLMKRMLTIEVTEREPFARLKYPSVRTPTGRDNVLFLIDIEGHVLESISVEAVRVPARPGVGGGEVSHGFSMRDDTFPDTVVTLVAEGDKLPKIGTLVQTADVQLGIDVLKTALFEEPELARNIESIDARNSQKIKIQFNTMRFPAWIAADMIDLGIHHIALFLKQQKLWMRSPVGDSSEATYTYVDARFENTIYLGGEKK